MEATILIDNHGDESRFTCEWGLSIAVEYDGHRFLLDTGSTGAFVKNADVLGIDLNRIDDAVLSHPHYDHADGLEAFFSRNDHAPVWLRACCREVGESCYSFRREKKEDGTTEEKLCYIGMKKGVLDRYAQRFCYVDGRKEIYPGVWLLPHAPRDYTKISARSRLYIRQPDGRLVPDSFGHEQDLVFETDGGLVIFNSCSHTGVKNILEEVRAAFPGKPVRALVGGLHLFRLHDEETMQIADYIKTADVGQILTGHCTGGHACRLLQRELGEKVRMFETGETIRF